MSIPDAVKTLSEHKILSAPVITVPDQTYSDWRGRYLGIIDYSAVLVWVLESAEHAAEGASSASYAATTAGGIGGAGAVGAIGAIALGVTGPAAVAGLTAAAVCSAVAGSAVGKIGEMLLHISHKFKTKKSCTNKNNKCMIVIQDTENNKGFCRK